MLSPNHSLLATAKNHPTWPQGASSLEEAIKQAAMALGFHNIGIVAVADMETNPQWQTAQENYQAWLSQGFHAGMEWMTRYTELRLKPWQILEGTQSIVCVAISYKHPSDDPQASPELKVAEYAWGKDYHRIIRKRLQKLLDLIQQWCPGIEGRPLTDSAPALEKPLAQLAGLGWQGKNTLLIHPTLGSTFFLGELLLTLPLQSDAPFATDHCGNCTQCLDVCPTQAFPQPGVLDSNRCISYWTIETDPETVFPTDIADNLNGWVFGCDSCQQVCPFNQRPPGLLNKDSQRIPIIPEPAFFPRPWIQSPDATQWQTLDETTFNRWFQANPIQRAGLTGLQRNIVTATSSTV
ncbi:MAG: tRNA epoxyqueuosine(34) reductase QueG [Vampirovibrionales bacterium]|nr:tRNA epoxyqueuosine(34) reductase QueG [Vampirovibrionales bacterium]